MFTDNRQYETGSSPARKQVGRYSFYSCLPMLALLGVLFFCSALISPAQADVNFSVMPAYTEVEPGEIFFVELTITSAGAEFNAYDAYVSYDPDLLTFIQLSPLSEQEGPLMTEACGTRFHLFEIAADSTSVGINHALLCQGVAVTGPGVVYQLCFQAGTVDADTHLRLLEGTTFYDDGLFVLPLFTEDAIVRVGAGSTPVPTVDLARQVSLAVAPNPFNPRTVLSFDLDRSQQVSLHICSLAGRVVRSLVCEWMPAGRHAICWDGRDDRAEIVASGCYLAVLETAAGRDISRLALVR